jgi:hypothetical protein
MNTTTTQMHFLPYHSGLSYISTQDQLNNNNYDLVVINNHLLTTPSYIVIAEEQGHYTLIRRISECHELEGLTISSDDEYTPYKQTLNKIFINGFTQVAKELIIIHN